MNNLEPKLSAIRIWLSNIKSNQNKLLIQKIKLSNNLLDE